MILISTKKLRIIIAILTTSCLLLTAPVASVYAYNPERDTAGQDESSESNVANDAGAEPDSGDPDDPAEPGAAVTLPALRLPKPVLVKAPSKAKAAVAIDAETGDVFSNKNKDKPLPVASVSKIMTVWLVMEKINAGNGSLKSKLKIRNKSSEKLSRDPVCGGYVLKRGQTFTVSELLHLTIICSSNAAATQLGIWVGGSNKAFIKKMNKEADRLGLTKSSFTSACGLNNYDTKKFGLKVTGGASGTNLMSAYDVANLARVLIAKYPNVLSVSGIPAVKIKGKWIGSTNKLLTDSALRKKAKPYRIDGLKTGTTRRAGSCLVATGNPNDKHRIITVLLNDSNKFEDTYTLIKGIYDKNILRLDDDPFPFVHDAHSDPEAKRYGPDAA
jgi:D-alanyl-D-alanine carboxypeptidase